MSFFRDQNHTHEIRLLFMDVVCALIIRGNKFFLARRSDSHLWELPGGKVEAGESLQQALSRELCEELELHIPQEKLTKIGQVRTNRIRLHAFATTLSQKESWTPREHCATAWTTPQTIFSFPKCEADSLFFANYESEVGGFF